MNDYKNVLEQDLSREDREKRREIIQERKAEWVMRGKKDGKGSEREDGRQTNQP